MTNAVTLAHNVKVLRGCAQVDEDRVRDAAATRALLGTTEEEAWRDFVRAVGEATTTACQQIKKEQP